MKIASVSTLYPTIEAPQAGVFVQRRLSALARLADIRVLKPHPWFPVVRPFRAGAAPSLADQPQVEVAHRRMPYVPGIAKSLDGRWLERAIYPILKKWRSEWGLEVIDAHFGYPTGVGAFRAGAQLGLPVFITVRGLEVKILRSRQIRPQLIEALKCCAGVICVSESLRHMVIECGIAPDKTRMISNSVDESVFYPGRKQTARQALGLPATQPLVLSVGSLVSGKGFHVLVEAFQEVRRARSGAQLVILGGPAYEPSYPASLRRRIEQLNLSDCVRLSGAVPPDSVAQWLRAADVFALPTYREGCCNAVLEALACGVPVVTTAAGDNEVYVKAPLNGLIVPMDSPRELGAAISEVLSETWDHTGISRRVTSGGWNAVAADVLDFFATRIAERQCAP